MAQQQVQSAVGVGDPAPEFTLPGLDPARQVTLSAYRGRSNVLLGLFRGLHCPFCRRQVALLNGIAPRLNDEGIKVVAVINTEPARMRGYYRSQTVRIDIGADPDWRTHARYGLGRLQATEGPTDWPRGLVNMDEFMALKVDPTGELDAPMSPVEANWALNKKDGFELDAVDQRIFDQHGMTGAGHFLIDRVGVVRWAWREGEAGMATMATFPTRQQILDAVLGASR